MRTDCHDIQQSLGPLLSGELTGDDAARVEIHLSSCDACARLRDRFRRLDARLQGFLAMAKAPSRDEVLLMALRARTESRRAIRVRRFLAAAAIAFTLLVPAAAYFTVGPATAPSTVAFDGFGGPNDVDF